MNRALLEIHRRDPVRSGLAFSTWQGMTYLTYATCAGGIYLTGLVTLLGGGSFDYALLSAIPPISGIVQIFAAHAARHAATRKSAASFSLLLALLFWIPAIVCAAVDSASALSILFVCFAAGQTLTAVHVNLWTAWFSDLVPPRIRGRYLGFRNMACAAPALAIGPVMGHMLDDFKQRGAEKECILFFLAAGVVFGLISILCLILQYEPPVRRRPPGGFARSLTTPMRDANFRRFALFIIFFNFFNGFASPIWIPFTQNQLHTPYETFLTFGLVAGIAGIFAMAFWGRFSDRFGNKPILLVTIFVSSAHPLLYIIASPDFLTPILIDNVSSAVVWGGFGLALFNLTLTLAPEGETEMYVALATVLTGAMYGLGSLACGILLDIIPALTLFGKTFSHFDVVFLTTSAARLLSLFLILPIVESKAQPVGHMIGTVFDEMKERIAAATGFFFGR